jgi:pyruvate kinase
MGVKLPRHKTKIVCTIGPASRSEAVLDELMNRGMNVARLNFSHGTVESHREDIRRIRSAAAKQERSCMILVDLPGPKIRIGDKRSGFTRKGPQSDADHKGCSRQGRTHLG